MNNHFASAATAVLAAAMAMIFCGAPRAHAAQEPPHARVLVTHRIDERRLVRLAGNTRREANARNDRGRVREDFLMEHMLLLLKRPPELEEQFEQYTVSLTDRSSANFRHWLTAEQQGQLYGPAQPDIDTVMEWLKSHGFTVGPLYPNRTVIDFSGTAAQVGEAFHTEIHHLDVDGRRHFANMSDPQIPEALAPFVVGVISMHDFEPHTNLEVGTQYQVTCGQSTCAGAKFNLLTPADLQTIYNLTPLFRQGIYGQGETIAVVEDAMPWGSDPTTYQTTFNLGVYGGSWSNTHPNVGGNCTAPVAGSNSDEGEANLDVEIALAVAPGATVQAASCATTTTSGVFIAIENLISSASPPTIISVSYGGCEADNGAAANAAIANAYQTAANAGISVFVSTGDQLSSGCSNTFNYGYFGVGVSGWASTPYNVAVGGTDFEDTYNAAEGGNPTSTYWNTSNSTIDGNAKSYVPEIPWNDSCASWLISNLEGFSTTYGTSGFCNSTTATTGNAFITIGGGSGGPSGCAQGAPTTAGYVTAGCAGWSKPSWQSGIFGNPADGVRDLPDVSLFAGNGTWGHFHVICWSDTANFASSGAASCTNPPNPVGATVTWSGFGGTSAAAPMMAAIQSLVNQKWGLTTGAGNPDSTYYQIANAEFGSGGNSECYSINQPPRRGLASACAFYDITQGDINVDCRQNGPFHPCYIPSGTNGVLSAEPAASVSAISGGSGYTSAPTCTISAPATSAQYLSPTGATLYAGGSQAGTCTATIGGGKVTSIALNPSPSGAGYAGGSGCTLTGGGGTGATCAVEVNVNAAPTSYAPAFYATPGWDFATGLGSVNAYNLVFNTAW